MITVSDVFRDVKTALPAERVLEHYLGPPRGRRFLCSFHEDRHPSLTCKDGGIVCWACAWRGDLFKFIQEHEGVSKGEALRIAADMAGVVLPDRRGKTGQHLPSLARSHARVVREIAAVKRELQRHAEKAAALAWRTAWTGKQNEEVWNTIALGAWLERRVEILKMEMNS